MNKRKRWPSSIKSATAQFEELINKTEQEVQCGEVSEVFDSVDDFINGIKSRA